jgi:hypothetical protein
MRTGWRQRPGDRAGIAPLVSGSHPGSGISAGADLTRGLESMTPEDRQALIRGLGELAAALSLGLSCAQQSGR